MRTFLAIILTGLIASDIARQYPSGAEPAKSNPNAGLQYGPGKELAHQGNANLAHDYKDDRTR